MRAERVNPRVWCARAEIRDDGTDEDIVNGYTLNTEREGGTQGSGPNRMAIHVGWMPVQSAQAILDLPDPAELSQNMGLFLEMITTTPTGERVDLPS